MPAMGEEANPGILTLEVARRVVERARIPFPCTLHEGARGWRLVLAEVDDLRPAVVLDDEDLARLCGRALAAGRKREVQAKLSRKSKRKAAEREARKGPEADRRVARAFRSHTRGWSRTAKRRAWTRVRWCTSAAEVVSALEAYAVEREDKQRRKIIERRAAVNNLRAAGFVASPSGARIAVRRGAALEPNVKRLLERLGLGDAMAKAEAPAAPVEGVSAGDVEIVEG